MEFYQCDRPLKTGLIPAEIEICFLDFFLHGNFTLYSVGIVNTENHIQLQKINPSI